MTPTDQGNANKVTLRDEDLKYFQIVQQALLEKDVHPPDWRNATAEDVAAFREIVSSALVNSVMPKSLPLTSRRITDAMLGVGLLEPFIHDISVDEVYVRGTEIAVERGGKVERHVGEAPVAYWQSLIERVAEMSGKSVNPGYSAVLLDLPNGARFTGMLPPIMDEPAINIRIFKPNARDLNTLRSMGAFEHRSVGGFSGTPADILDKELREKIAGLPDGSIEQFLAWCAGTLSANILFAGPFSSGKTTLMNAVLSYIPSDAPIAILETFRELQMSANLFSMRAIAPSERENGPASADKATMEWVLNTIYTRANPAAIVLGEIVSAGEALQFVKAANLGRRAFATIHGGSARSALSRLDTLTLGAQPSLGLGPVRRMVADGIDLVVLMQRKLHANGAYRFVGEMVRVKGVDANNEYILETIYRADENDQEQDVIGPALQHMTGKVGG